jgi:transposase
VQVGIETDHGPWVRALIATGYVVFAVNPLQASRFRSRHGVSGAKSDGGDAHMLADVVRTDAQQLRPAAGDSPAAEAVKVLSRTHKTLIWERAAVVLRLRAHLLEYFPAAVAAFEDLDAPDTLELLGKAPDPARAAKLTRAQIAAALKRAGRYKITDRTSRSPRCASSTVSTWPSGRRPSGSPSPGTPSTSKPSGTWPTARHPKCRLSARTSIRPMTAGACPAGSTS